MKKFNNKNWLNHKPLTDRWLRIDLFTYRYLLEKIRKQQTKFYLPASSKIKMKISNNPVKNASDLNLQFFNIKR